MYFRLLVGQFWTVEQDTAQHTGLELEEPFVMKVYLFHQMYELLKVVECHGFSRN